MSVPVSQAYINMMLGCSLESRAEILISNGTDSTLVTSKDIVKDSLSANWRSSNNKTLTLGTCYATSFSVSSFKNVETGYEGEMLTVTPTLYFKVQGGEQSIPLGVFYCENPEVFIRTTAYECLDGMVLFDKPVTARFSGTAYNVLTYICSQCDVVFGNTAQQVSAMINSNRTLVIDPAEVSTYRDALSYVSIVLGGYCAMGRDGKLYVKHFHAVPDRTLERGRRISASFAGYKTRFAGVKCRFLAQKNYFPYESNDGLDGIVMDLGDIPIIEDTEEVKHDILDAIWGVVRNIEYSPCEIDMVGDPSIEAGDMITTKDRYGYDRNVLLTSVSYRWRNASTILSEGANPKYASVSTASKRAEKRAENQAQQNTVVTATYANANNISVGSSDDTEITSLRFITNKDLTAIFGAEIPVYSNGDGYVEITYSDSGIEGDTVRARVHEGYNLVTLVNHLYFDASRVVLLQLKAKTEALSGGNAPTLTIAQDTIRSYIFAQGIEIEAPWDGIITIAEDIGYVSTYLEARGITDSLVIEVNYPAQNVLSEILQSVSTTLQTRNISDSVDITVEYGDQILRMGEGHRAGMGRMYVRF